MGKLYDVPRRVGMQADAGLVYTYSSTKCKSSLLILFPALVSCNVFLGGLQCAAASGCLLEYKLALSCPTFHSNWLHAAQ
jgi:hypothetical protein